MLRSRRTAAVLAAIATATSLATALVAPVHAAAPTVELQPHQLPRGADIAVPHIEDGQWGHVFVDGARRIELPGRVARVIGPSLLRRREATSWRASCRRSASRLSSRRIVLIDVASTRASPCRLRASTPWSRTRVKLASSKKAKRPA